MAQSIRHDGKTGLDMAQEFVDKFTKEKGKSVSGPRGAGTFVKVQPHRIKQEWTRKASYSFPSKKG